MVVKMPYGEVEINTSEEAKKFILHACDSCEYSTLWRHCSGARSYRCSCEKYKVAKEFGVWV